MKKTFSSTSSGFSIIEVILAVGLFIILVSGSVGTVLQGFGLNRVAEEQTIANQFASEGLEATRSIRNQAFANLVNTVGTGLAQSSGLWIFSGSNNQYGPSNKFTRTIAIADVQRDGSGNIVASGGTPDADTKKVTSTVTWNNSPTISDSVILSTYLTNFKKAIGSALDLIFYGIGTTTPQYRSYNNTTNAFNAQTATLTGAAPLTTATRNSPTAGETISGYVTAAGVLQVMCFNGTTWTNEWSTTVGGSGTTRRFDIAYETNSGDVIVLYSTNASTTNELGYRTKSGSTGCGTANWSAATNFDPIRTSGTVQWIKMAWDRRGASNLLAATWADSNSDLSSAIWNGSSWTNEPSAAHETSLAIITTAQDVDDFDLEYESSSGDLMVVWANSAGKDKVNGVRYNTCAGGVAACTWGSTTAPPTFSDDATNLDLAANPSNDELVFASVGDSAGDLQAGYWSGTAWTNTANLATNCTKPVAGSRKVAAGWLSVGGTNRSIIVYDDNGGNQAALSWVVGSGGTFTIQTDFVVTPVFNNNQGTYLVETNPLNSSELMVVVVDLANDLFAKELTMTATPTFTWAETEGGTALSTALPQNISYPTSFAWHRKP